MISLDELQDRSRWHQAGSTWVGPGTGAALDAAAGQVVVFRLRERPQVVDLNLFRRPGLRERFGASVTRPIHGTHLSVGDELLSCPPWERAMARVVGDSVSERSAAHGEHAARSHDLLFGRCSSALRRHLYDSDTPGCQENLAGAIAPFGLTEHDVHDPLNVFMHTGVDDGKIFFAPPAAREGDMFAIELLLDCLVAVSACPGMSSGPDPGGVEVVTFARVAPSEVPRPR